MTATDQALEVARVAARAAVAKLASDPVAFDVSERLAITDIFRFPTVRAIAAHLSSDAAPANSAADRGAARAAARLARMGRR